MIKLGSFVSILSLIYMSNAQAQETSINDDIIDNDVITVIGPNLNETLAVLQNCIDNRCQPDIDIDATLAHAENLFIEGEYKSAEDVIKASIKRNRKFASQYPLAVSDLYRSGSRIMEHLGRIDASNFNIIKASATIKKNLSSERAILAADLEIAGSRLKSGAFGAAKRRYKRVHRKATELGFEDLAGVAKIRELHLRASRALSFGSSSLIKKAQQEIFDYIDEVNDPEDKYSAAAKLIFLRLDSVVNDTIISEHDIGSFARIFADPKKPILLSSDPISSDLLIESGSLSVNNRNLISTLASTYNPREFENRWADIGFIVNENGRVENIEALRIKGDDSWIEAIITHINSRIYSPRIDPDNKQPIQQYVIERFTYTLGYDDNSKSRVRTLAGRPIIRMLDLTLYD